MKTLLTSEQAAALAFAGGEYVAPEAIPDATLAAVQERYVKPVTGEALLGALLEGSYEELRDTYVVPAAAAWLRVMLLPRMNLQTGGCGLAAVARQGWQAAGGTTVTEALKQARAEARTLLARLSDHLEQHAARYPEYRPADNILNRCRIHGDLVQIR